jgi:hypothetical protein
MTICLSRHKSNVPPRSMLLSLQTRRAVSMPTCRPPRLLCTTCSSVLRLYASFPFVLSFCRLRHAFPWPSEWICIFIHSVDCLTEAPVTTHAVHCSWPKRQRYTYAWGHGGDRLGTSSESGSISVCDSYMLFIPAPFDFVSRGYVNNQANTVRETSPDVCIPREQCRL